MKTNKYQQVKSLQEQSNISGTQLDSSIQSLLGNVKVSLVYPVIKTKIAGSDGMIQIQIALIVFNKEEQIVQHSQVSEFNQYLASNKDIKQVNIKCIQISKLNKVQSGKIDTIIDSGKNIGKKSETTIFQQAIQEAQKKYSKFIGQKNDIYPHFMLLDLYKYNRSQSQTTEKTLEFPQYVQRKYDGLRCGAFIGNESNVVLLSRGHKEFTTLTGLQLAFKELFSSTDSDPEFVKIIKTSTNLMIDGELYIHGKSLQSLNSIIRNSNNLTDKDQIQFLAYDIDITFNNRQSQMQLPFNMRLELLGRLDHILNTKAINCIQIAPTTIVNSKEELDVLFQQFINEKYEGAVIRSPNSLYCYSINNKRSSDSVKYKLKLDMEVQVIGIIEGSGKDMGAIIYQCVTPQTTSDHSFQVVQNTTYDKRRALFQLLNNKPDYLSLLKKIPLNIEYATLSAIGVPQQPRGIYFRTENIEFEIPLDLISLLE